MPVQLEKKAFLETLETRFKKHIERHPQVNWEQLQIFLEQHEPLLQVAMAMEASGGEVDVIEEEQAIAFYDCAKESPLLRRSYCYDRAAWEKRKNNKPVNTVEDACEAMGVELLDEAQYRYLQTKGEFDLKTSSWIKTPEKVRALGGAYFADRRYDMVFVYHNSADSYYSARGFRTRLLICADKAIVMNEK